MTRRIVVLSAGLSDPSSTRLLADRLAAATTAALADAGEAAEVETIELRPVAHDIVNNLLTGFAAGPLAAAQRSIEEADAVIAVTPVFTASYSGLFKSFVDVLDKDALAGTPVLIGATAGTARHSLMLDHALRPLFGYLRAVVAPTGVFAASEDWASDTANDGGELSARIDRAGAELAALVAARPERANDDRAADFTDFATLLAGVQGD